MELLETMEIMDKILPNGRNQWTTEEMKDYFSSDSREDILLDMGGKLRACLQEWNLDLRTNKNLLDKLLFTFRIIAEIITH